MAVNAPTSAPAGQAPQVGGRQADRLVVFGITGDLAKVMTFRSLYRLEKRGVLDCPILGVAVDDWDADDLREHARAAIAAGEPVDDAVFERFAARLSYLRGNFTDADTYTRLAAAIGDARQPVFYLEIPPFLFGTVVAGLATAGLTANARVVVDMAHIAGLVAGGMHPSPVPHADFVTSTTHKTLRGPRSGLILCREQYAKELDRALFPGVQGGPLMHIIAAKAVCFKEAMEPSFAEYQRQIVANAQALAASLSGHGFRLVSGGTDNHLMLVDVFSKGVTGKAAESALGKAGITVNKNAIPFDQNPPMVASGIRVGTPALTTRGMRQPEMDQIGALIARVLAAPDDARAIGTVRAEVERLCRRFPLYDARSD